MIRDIEKELGLEDVLAVESSVLSVRMDTRRYGKSVTLIDGFDPAVDVQAVAKDLKDHLGTGGTVKEGRVELQGDHRRAARTRLESKGFRIG